MRLLCFSDLHRDKEAAAKLVELSVDADCVIGAGDFANCRKGIADTLDILSQIQKPTVLVPGNGESVEELRAATVNWESAQVLHGNGCQIAGLEFWGVGGGIPITPFGDWSYDFDEKQATEMLEGCPDGGVLVVHSPPLDTVDRDSTGQIRGSQAIRDVVSSKQPRLVVCGHIHSDWGKRVKLGTSEIVNAGPAGLWCEIKSLE